VEEDYPITTFFENKGFSIFFANGPMIFINLRAVSRKVRHCKFKKFSTVA